MPELGLGWVRVRVIMVVGFARVVEVYQSREKTLRVPAKPSLLTYNPHQTSKSINSQREKVEGAPECFKKKTFIALGAILWFKHGWK